MSGTSIIAKIIVPLRTSSSLWINPCIRGKPLTPKWVILQTAETQKKCRIMRSFI